MYGGNFDNENAAIEAAIKTKHKSKLGKVEAVVGFSFTVGTEETDAMTSKQVSTHRIIYIYVEWKAFPWE